jgi:hypothetical protein
VTIFQAEIMIWSPAITAVLIGIVAALSFGGGFALGDWRMVSRLERLSSDNALLSTANDRCAMDIERARVAMDALRNATITREQNAAKAMQTASKVAVRHTKAARKIQSLPPAKPEQQCQKMTIEQMEYVRGRHQNE